MTTKTDVLILGGGSIGLNCAYALLRSGRSVTLLDSGEIGAGSSSGNAGHIVPSHIVPLAAPGVIPTALKWLLDPANSPFGLKISANPAYLRWLTLFAAACTEENVRRAIPAFKALGLLSAARFAEIIAAENFDCAYQQSGLLFLYQTEAAFAGGKHEAEVLHQNGLPAEVLEREAVHAREPLARASVLGGVHFTGDASLHPAEFLHLLSARVAALGADLRPNSPATGFESQNGKITRVQTPAEEFEPALVILAAGAWSPAVARGLRLNLPIQPARGYSLTAKAPQILPRQALLLGERKVAITPLDEKLRLTGRLEIGEMSTTTNPRWLAAIERAAREYIQMDEKLEIEETWAGLRPTTPDGLPIIGFAPRYENLILATGHAMLGLSLGPGSGEVVAALANGRAPAFDLRPFAPQRF
ncbi:MAG: FAD-dependent oxidoreductase [Anaerolineales bacterium]